MKINVAGRGVVPGIGTLAPIYNHEMDEAGVRRLMNFPTFRVYDSKSGILITRRNIDSVIESHKKVTVDTPVKINHQTIDTMAIETPTVPDEPTVSEYIPPVLDLDSEEVMESNDTVVEEEAVDEETAAVNAEEDDADDEDRPKYAQYNKKNKKKNRH